ncbi:CheY-like superfamily [Xylariomycetidae sp. FL0641]|nr:CheY-like superfamily [Xylariomycetidae sp. FL0641]
MALRVPLLEHGSIFNALSPKKLFLVHENQRSQREQEAFEALEAIEPAPIQEVETFDDGLKTTITYTFRATDEEKEAGIRPLSTSRGLSFLCAEDNGIQQRINASFFQKYGQDFIMVKNGQEAVNVYKSHPNHFDCILMDIGMPVMDGFEATRLIRDFEDSTPGIRSAFIIAVFTAYTGYTGYLTLSGQEERRMRLHRFDAWMGKTFHPVEFYQTLLGGPATNLILANCTGLTDDQTTPYPLIAQQDKRLWGKEARSKAIIHDIKTRANPRWLDPNAGPSILLPLTIKIKVVT